MINSAVFVGRLTRDPELEQKQSGPVTKFKLAVDRAFKREGGQEADFFNCVCFNKTAELVAQYCDKGMLVGVEGRVEIDIVEKDGHANYYTNVIANNVRFLESRAEAERRRAASGQPAPSQAPAPAQAAEEQEDPFA